jgi:hypothetical protein
MGDHGSAWKRRMQELDDEADRRHREWWRGPVAW